MSTFTLSYEHPEKKVRIERVWTKGSETVRCVETETIYNYTTEQYEETLNRTRTYDIDEHGCLVGDGSYWLAEGTPWRQYAHNRHHTLLSLRFPHTDFE
jgi:hypothetical protein